MCTSSDDVDEILFMVGETAADNLTNTKCIKCQNEATVKLQKRNAYCNNCVIQSINHKFRATLGKSKLIKPGQHILLAHSGGKCSSVLLHLVSKGLSDTSHKKLKIRISVIYIDDGILSGRSLKERDDINNAIRKQLESYDFDFHVCSQAEAMRFEDSSRVDDVETVLESYINSIASETSKIDSIEYMRNRLIFEHAKKIGCSFIFVGDHSPKLAIKLLSNACLGRGSQLSHYGFVDNRCENVTLLRPMKDITQEELEIYIIYHNLSIPNSSSVTVKNNKQITIQRAIHNFVTDLQNNYPATVSTIQKTGDKLGVSETAEYKADVCIVCQSNLDTNVQQSSALQAIKFSKTICLLGPNNSVSGGIETISSSSCGRNGDCACAKEAPLSRQQIETYLCYGCVRTLDDVNDLMKLPEHITNVVRRNIAFTKIHDEIKDFLL